MDATSKLSDIVRSSFFLYLGALIFNVVGFLYWIIASLYVPPDAVGSASAILSLESLFINIFSLGVPIGIRRFIGAGWSQDNKSSISDYLSVALGFSLAVNIPVILVLLLMSGQTTLVIGLTQFELLFVAALICLDFWPSLFASLFISIMKTKITTVANSGSSVAKLIIGVILLQSGFGFAGILLSIIASSLVRSFTLIGYATRLSKKLNLDFRPKLNRNIMKELLKAGSASWVPNTLLVVGQTLGVLIIYGYAGGGETGLYFIAFAIATAVYNLPGSVQSLMFPVLSGMNEGKEQAISNTIRLSLAITAPTALALAVYSFLPFSLLGPAYSNAGVMLTILLMGTLLYPIITGYSSYIYAIGKYVHVALIDLVSTVTRISFYFILIIPFQGVGASYAFVLGVVASVIPVLISSRRIGFNFPLWGYLGILSIPSLVALLVHLMHLNLILGGSLIMIASFIAYTRFGVITKSDLKEMALAFLSPESAARVQRHMKRLVVVLFGD